MEKEKLEFTDFLQEAGEQNSAFLSDMHQQLTDMGCKLKIEQAKSGMVVSYTVPKQKKTILNYVFRKAGVVVRVYGDHVQGDTGLLHSLPDKMKKAIQKASACRRLVDPAKCNSRCPMGYVFELDGEQQVKCRYSCFSFLLEEESKPHISRVILKEMEQRASAEA